MEKAYLYHTEYVTHMGGAELAATICNDFGKINNQSVVFEGRFPKYDNEIALAAKYARERGFAIGEEIEITANGRQAAYLITGFTQVTNNLGKDCLLTRAGYERLGTLANTSYYLNLSEETDVDGFTAEIKERFGANVYAVINIRAVVGSSAGVYVSLMTMIVIAVFVLSALIIAFVLYLLVRTMLNQKSRDHGIMKALGFTTGQLVLQTALSFLPTMIASTALGLTVCSFIIDPLMAVFLGGLGIVKCTFAVPVGSIAAAGTGLVLFAFGLLCLLSLRIKKITPKTLLSGE